MQTYKINKNSWTCLKNFASLESAQTFADTLGEGYTATLAPPNEQIQPQTPTEKIQSQFDFGIELIKLFRLDNAQYEIDNNTAITPTETVALMSKFQPIISLCQVGAIKEVSVTLPSIVTDEIFTQARKDKYLNIIQNYLA